MPALCLHQQRSEKASNRRRRPSACLGLGGKYRPPRGAAANWRSMHAVARKRPKLQLRETNARVCDVREIAVAANRPAKTSDHQRAKYSARLSARAWQEMAISAARPDRRPNIFAASFSTKKRSSALRRCISSGVVGLPVQPIRGMVARRAEMYHASSCHWEWEPYRSAQL